MLSAGNIRKILQMQQERLARIAYRKGRFCDQDEFLQEQMVACGTNAIAMSDHLVGYFWRAYRHYVDDLGTLAYYPGYPSIYGARNDAIEGVSRLLPLWAAYSSCPFGDAAMSQSMRQQIRRSLVQGTDPAHAGYWGPMRHRSTLICEGADVALCIWLCRSSLWVEFGSRDQGLILTWLKQAVGKDTADNNWHLFVVLIDAILANLDPAHRFTSHDRLRRVREFYLSDGCFRDGPNGPVDFYNAWGFHYLLYWISEIAPELAADMACDALTKFCNWYQYLFTTDGLPLFGRSLCYRFAACGPLLSCAAVSPATISPGVAVSAYVANWQYFAKHGGLRFGRPTQGVFGDDLRWLDPYSGPASSFWSTRSIVLFCYVARQLDWRTVAPETLPAERQNVEVRVQGLAAWIRTNMDRRESVVQFDAPRKQPSDIRLLRPGKVDKLRQWVYASASRPGNNLLRDGLGQFSSKLDIYRESST